jgi:FKBP-type peptidyl-prolyl cis-trans isomerase FkpA
VIPWNRARVLAPRTALALISALTMASVVPRADAQQGGAGRPADEVQAPTPHPSAKKKGAPGAEAGKSDVKTEGSYSLGVAIGTQLHNLGLSKDAVVFDKVVQGLRESLNGTAQAGPADQQKVQALVQGSRATMAEANRAAAKKFLAENAKQKDVTTTASGLQYQVIAPGSGDPPHATDEVTVNYRGTLLNGTEFDSSIKRGQPATFPVNGVIRGWQEALVLMKPGAKWNLFIPPELAYGDNSPPPIPPGSLLKFEVELLSVKAPAAGAGGLPGGVAPGGGANPSGPPPKSPPKP